MNQIYGEWTTKDDVAKAYFTCSVKTNRDVVLKTVNINVTEANSYSSIDELLLTLPLYAADSQTLSRYIAQDSTRGFGSDYPDLGIVAYVGQSHMDRPIAKVTKNDGTVVFVAHPQINNLVKRYR